MAGCEPLVRALLLADPVVGPALGGTRMYPLIRPQGSALPAITYQRVSRVRVDPFSRREPAVADARVQNARLQLDCWAATYGEVKDLAADVLAVLAGYVGTAPAPALRAISALPDERDLYEAEPAPPVYRVSSDFSVWWDEE